MNPSFKLGNFFIWWNEVGFFNAQAPDCLNIFRLIFKPPWTDPAQKCKKIVKKNWGKEWNKNVELSGQKKLTARSSPRSCWCDTPASVARLRSVLVNGRLRSMLLVVTANMSWDCGGVGGRSSGWWWLCCFVLGAAVGWICGEAGGVGDPGETPFWWRRGLTWVVEDGGLTAPTTAPAAPLPRLWQSAHCIRNRVTASRGRNA